MRFIAGLLVSTIAALVLVGCTAKGDSPQTTAANGDTAESFLKWSMDKAKEVPAMTAKVTINSTNGTGFPGMESTRTFDYKAPNQFKVISTGAGGFVQTSVSDGKELVEYTNNEMAPGSKGAAPEHLFEVSSMQMNHPMFCGTLLYQFFGGAANFDKLVDLDKGKVEFGKRETVDGEPAKLVKFFAEGTYGNTQVLI